jgi:ribosomal protein L24
MGHYYRFKRGDTVIIVSGRYKGHWGVVDSAVFQRTVDYPEEVAPGNHVVLDDGMVVTVRWDQVKPGN